MNSRQTVPERLAARLKAAGWPKEEIAKAVADYEKGGAKVTQTVSLEREEGRPLVIKQSVLAGLDFGLVTCFTLRRYTRRGGQGALSLYPAGGAAPAKPKVRKPRTAKSTEPAEAPKPKASEPEADPWAKGMAPKADD